MSKNGGKDRDSGGTGNGEKLTLEGSFQLYTYIVWFYSLVIDLMNVIDYW